MLKRLTRPELSGIWLVDSASSIFPGGNAGEGTREEFKYLLRKKGRKKSECVPFLGCLLFGIIFAGLKKFEFCRVLISRIFLP